MKKYFGPIVVVVVGLGAIALTAVLNQDLENTADADTAMIDVKVEESFPVREDYPILVSAKHLDPIEGYKMIYSEDNDRAVYIKEDHKYMTVEEGTEVEVRDEDYNIIIRGEVTKSSEGVFYVKVDDPTKVYGGMSGMRVYSSSQELGFVSALTPDLQIECLTVF